MNYVICKNNNNTDRNTFFGLITLPKEQIDENFIVTIPTGPNYPTIDNNNYSVILFPNSDTEGMIGSYSVINKTQSNFTMSITGSLMDLEDDVVMGYMIGRNNYASFMAADPLVFATDLEVEEGTVENKIISPKTLHTYLVSAGLITPE